MDTPPALIISARRSALGRIGGLHRQRRVEDLSRLVIAAALADVRCDPDRADGLVLGNTTAGRNVARAVGLAAGLPETAFALTIDSQCASGLEAILDAIRRVSAGEAELVVAGGAESLSTAPWRIGRPKHHHQLPHFIGFHPQGADSGVEASLAYEADERLAAGGRISRPVQDAYVVQSFLAAERGRGAREFLSEIVGQRAVPEEMRDQVISEPAIDDLAEREPFHGDEGTVTSGNTSPLADGAAFAVIVSAKLWTALGRPPALAVTGHATTGVLGSAHAEAGRMALERVLNRATDKVSRSVGNLQAIEMAEISAIEAIAFARTFKLNDGVLNSGGGALIRGLPLGAAGAVSLTRLFTRLVRGRAAPGGRGAVAQRAAGGLGVAAVFEAVT